MALLTTQQRKDVLAALMQDLSRTLDACSVTKPNFQAAVDAADQWCEDNAVSFNTALPVAARTGLTAAQKARLLAAVAIKRFGG